MSQIKKYVITAMCITLCTVLPLVLHAVPGAGSTILPMHIPVLLCGLIAGPYFGLLAGLLGPLLSSFITGMPPMAYAPIMMTELAVYGAITGLLIRLVRTKNNYFNIYAALIPAMVVGRIITGIARALFFTPAAANETTLLAWWITSYFITSLPGIIIQLILLPIIIVALEKANLIRK
ncbi:MAG: ECF transporter S component [Firmicutes bacterium]|nr:ECF transporter S component [Bacillota bacterium]